MAAEFVGFTDVRHEQQAEGTELCFPTLIRDVTEASVSEAHDVLMAEGLSAPDGTTGLLIGDIQLDVAGTAVTIEPMGMPESLPQEQELKEERLEAAIAEMEEQFEVGSAVLMLYKKTTDPESDAYHWVLLTGFARADDYKGPIHVVDPLREETALLTRRVIGEMVERSVDYDNGGQGVYAYSLRTDSGPSHEPPRRLRVIPAYDQEPEPIQDTYTATKQDKAVSRTPA